MVLNKKTKKMKSKSKKIKSIYEIINYLLKNKILKIYWRDFNIYFFFSTRIFYYRLNTYDGIH